MRPRSTLMQGVALGALAIFSAVSVAHAQQTLPTIDVGSRLRAGVRAASHGPVVGTPAADTPAVSDDSAPSDAAYAPGFSPARLKQPIYHDPPGQTTTTVHQKFLKTTPMFTVQEMLQYSPGVSFNQGGFPREFTISIRGSGNRLNTGVRNIQMFEDGFPLVTADGNGRTEILDPHAYSAIDVYRGPSSAMFGNHAYGGAINFRTYSGAQIDGADTGSEAGSFGYVNNYVRVGKKVGDFDVALFASDARGDGFLFHNAYSNQTANLLAKWTPAPSDRFILKYLFNNAFSEMNLTTPLTTYYLNPFQYGCGVAIANNPYCFSTIAPRNGVTGGGPALQQSFAQMGSHAHLLRHITGLRWEHDFDNDTTLRTQVTYNYLDNVNGTAVPPRLGAFGIPTLRGPSVGLNVMTDITSFAPLFGYPARHYLGFVYENTKSTFQTFTQVANVWNYGMAGGAAGKADSYHSNISLRAREEVALSKDLTAVVGFSSNWNRVWGVNTVYNYRQPTLLMNLPSETAVDNDYWNTAPEVSLTYRFAPDWQLRTRYAAGYGTPTFSMLTQTPNGVGANPSLKAQTNMGVDVGVDWTPGPDLTVSLTGYHEWFRNEILTLFAGFPALTVYSINLPSSIHRGIELSTDWRPYEGWQFITAYSHNQQFITNFIEQLPAGGSVTAVRDRSGKWIPNVAPHTLTARAAYDVPHGEFKGVGAFVEYVFKSSYNIDPANLLRLPGYGLVNFNIHYNRDIADFYFRNVEVYVSLNNAFDRKFVAGAGVAQNTVIGALETPGLLLANSVAAIKAGQPRAVIGGVKLKF